MTFDLPWPGPILISRLLGGELAVDAVLHEDLPLRWYSEIAPLDEFVTLHGPLRLSVFSDVATYANPEPVTLDSMGLWIGCHVAQVVLKALGQPQWAIRFNPPGIPVQPDGQVFFPPGCLQVAVAGEECIEGFYAPQWRQTPKEMPWTTKSTIYPAEHDEEVVLVPDAVFYLDHHGRLHGSQSPDADGQPQFWSFEGPIPRAPKPVDRGTGTSGSCPAGSGTGTCSLD